MFRTDKGARGVFCASELCAGHGCYLNYEINGSKASFGWNQEEPNSLWMGCRDEDNRLITRNPNGMLPGARAVTALAKGHPEGWNDAFKGNFYAFYKYIEDGCVGEPIFSTLEQAAYIVKLTEAVFKSSKEKKWIRVNE